VDTQIGVCFERLNLRMPSLRNMVQVEVFVSKFHVSQAFFSRSLRKNYVAHVHYFIAEKQLPYFMD
jgi:hypothetical protein